ncbi:accessory factor UbiK family protein [Sphingomonas sp. BN140010]|uniref:Accessory factor UbiK family protein n=1 Tax=Sphingomonas arvum TaxID=2992113 RepID=A0ABT3JIF6_9SPHN|nr:accessory factor UbiK family protein [Sphingomonas sp. BN140010]MCW3798877.1 accessory factor UbiK family protein [Sphingomonas sp. BN140010]
MQSQNRLFDDFVKIMNGAAGTVAGMTREAQESMRERMREFVGGMDFVSRDEFEAVKMMAAQAREEVEALRNRLAALEASTGKGPASAGATPGTRKKGPATGMDTPEE